MYLPTFSKIKFETVASRFIGIAFTLVPTGCWGNSFINNVSGMDNVPIIVQHGLH